MNLPNAIIVGVQKCGTTNLFKSLIRHSSINGPIDPERNCSIKEVDFFRSDNKFNKGVNWYKSHFIGAKEIFIEASPNYLMEPNSINRMYEVIPDAKLIMCIRNPIHRAYSQYNHYKQALPQSIDWDWKHEMDFLNNLDNELKRGVGWEKGFEGFLSKGVYIEQIKLLLSFFDKSQIYISVMDQRSFNYENELMNILSFLGVKMELLPNEMHHMRHYTVEPMNVFVRNILKDFYKSYNDELFDFLGYNIPEWNK